ncbi:hypothetical protein [Silvanigrella sp.]|jgi:hypothetical protein|uniref:hypothetical protein n=1 Tax=Silvanigrella sp. TaxID=2024976 RepID=UPI0037C8977D
MEELLNLIIQFNDILRKQIQSYLEFLPILDEEEIAISNYDLASLERMVIIKDQHSRIAQSLEERRVIVLKKICYMMAFDPRGQNLSLKLFKFTFSTYIKNIKTLVGEVIYNKLLEQETIFNEISTEFEKSFEVVYPRIYRNQAILKKLMKNVSLSISLFQSEAEVGMNYDSLGKAQSLTNKNNGLSSMRVKA